ncbi:apolipoprotein N-acyltransferase [Mycobacterium intermedium]|uniref:apolipoprotein N-acyltransferase n=1 Tax=Mycobacterium intermedium TaxID=28445 RepID=UPI0009A1C79A|nr:apolipoprotein N-acyltransferase [Mycobacterium intermedium]MCV6967706.1 apolipoprotein N-acyltransferase [Mycobacterium intermedium]
MRVGWETLRQRLPDRLPGWAAASICGTLPTLAFPAPSWWWLGWVGLLPLLMVVRAAPSSRAGAVRCWWGLGAFVVVNQYWLMGSVGPFLLLLGFGLGALWLPCGWAAHRLLAAPVSIGRTVAAVAVVPSAWVLAEAVRSLPSLGGPWAPLGASQWNQPVTLASAAVGGVWLTSFLLAAANTALVGMILHRRPAVRLVMVGCAAVCAAVGPAWYVVAPTPAPGPTVRVALVQVGDITDASARQQAGEAITATLVGQRVDLVVWGESSVGLDLLGHPDVVARLAELSRRVGADLLVNVDAAAPGGGIYKSAVLLDAGGVAGSYRKTRLVPFGEYVPLRPLFGWITRHSKAAEQDRQRGTGEVVLHVGEFAVGPLVSYELTFSDLARREARLGAQLLVYQSATSSFQGTWAQPQLAAHAAVRAVEVGRPVAHVGLSGDSSAFDARGRLLAWCASDWRGVTVVNVPVSDGVSSADVTPYQRWGEWVPMTAVVVLICFAACGLFLRRPA